MSFAVCLDQRYGSAFAEKAVSFLEDLHLPVPRPDQFLAGKECVHVFLSPLGVTLRFGERVQGGHSDYVLQPLLEIPFDDHHSIEVLPGIRVAEINAVQKLSFYFDSMAHGVPFKPRECVRDNIGVIAVPHGEMQKERCVILDRGAFRAKAGEHDTRDQDFLFGPFARKARGFYDPVDHRPIAARFIEFAALCIYNLHLPENEPARVLHNSWAPQTRTRRKSSLAVQAAANYETGIAAVLPPALKGFTRICTTSTSSSSIATEPLLIPSI